jgi:transposase
MDGTGMARYVVDAVLLEGRSPREVARAHGISKSWIYELIARYRAGGYDALAPTPETTALLRARNPG